MKVLPSQEFHDNGSNCSSEDNLPLSMVKSSDFEENIEGKDWICCILCKKWICGVCSEGSKRKIYVCPICENDI